jgi:hypothetical protein
VNGRAKSRKESKGKIALKTQINNQTRYFNQDISQRSFATTFATEEEGLRRARV